MRITAWNLLVLAAAAGCGSALGQDEAPAPAAPGPERQAPADKRAFTLFNPTPADRMREMSVDRPDATEAPYTVDAGHFQFELSLAEYVYDDDTGVETDAYAVLPVNFKIGLLHNTDLQFLLAPYVREEIESDGNRETADGFGDTQVRLKVNLWGNDGWAPPGLGGTAFAIMPFVKFPTGADGVSNDHVEGGLILPLAVELPGSLELGLMAETDFVYNEAEDDYGFEFVHTAALGRGIAGPLAGYVEYVGIAPHDTGAGYQAIGSAGLTYTVSDDWILDLGATASPSDDADDFAIFAGTSFRL